jgi:hypothetical protein
VIISAGPGPVLAQGTAGQGQVVAIIATAAVTGARCSKVNVCFERLLLPSESPWEYLPMLPLCRRHWPYQMRLGMKTWMAEIAEIAKIGLLGEVVDIVHEDCRRAAQSLVAWYWWLCWWFELFWQNYSWSSLHKN